MRFLILLAALAGICWLSVESRAGETAPGFLEGNLKVEVSGGAKLADDEGKDATVDYSEYPMVILRKANREEFAQVTADKNGRYRIPLPPGDYLLQFKVGPRKRAVSEPRPFTVLSQQTVRVDMQFLRDLSISGAPR